MDLGAIFGCPAHDQRDLDFAKNIQLMLFQLLNQNNKKMILKLQHCIHR